ncbi:type II toxin-antitoxin system RelB/DinJ family antitoxin [Treponema primitia]|uniref:type II toxin-antitoxin system RelB/DinJ family antitoxin n=1 Tax=Treponema primitia TaxID=88058 RepID=UPI00398053E1
MAQVNIRLDEKTKRQAEALFNDLGMNLSTAITIFIHQTIREQGIPFAITAKTDPFYNPANMKWLDESIQQGKDGKYIVKTMEELERLADE